MKKAPGHEEAHGSNIIMCRSTARTPAPPHSRELCGFLVYTIYHLVKNAIFLFLFSL